MKKIWFAVVICLLCFLGNAKADVVLSLSDVVVGAGEEAVVSVNIANTGGTPVQLSGYNIPLNILSDENFTFLGTPDGFRQTTSLGSFSAQLQSQVLNFNFGIADNGSPVELNATPTTLFELVFSVAADASSGATVPVTFQPTPEAAGTALPTFFSLTLDGTAANVGDLITNSGATVNNGSITVAAVPEPSSVAFAVLGMCGLALRRRRQ